MRKGTMPDTLDRRGFLRSVATGTALGASLVATRATAAMTSQRFGPDSAIGLDVAKRCGGTGEHAALLAELEARLALRSAAPGTTLAETATCPLCGCSVTAYRDVK